MSRIDELRKKAKAKTEELLKGRTFDEIVEIYYSTEEQIDKEGLDDYVLTVIASVMEKVDSDRFIKWCDEY